MFFGFIWPTEYAPEALMQTGHICNNTINNIQIMTKLLFFHFSKIYSIKFPMHQDMIILKLIQNIDNMT